jgi:hypothetical protein
MMIFVHYSDERPLFTYAVYSPRTKRVLHRQDVIFLTSIFPMRVARTASRLSSMGDDLKVFCSPLSMLDECPAELSFGTWEVGDALPDFDDDIAGFGVSRPYESYVAVPDELPGVPVHNPSHPSFPDSLVMVPLPAAPRDLSLRATGTDFAADDAFPVSLLPDPLASVKNCNVENGEECSIENGEERIFEIGESRDSGCLENGESHDPIVVPSDPAVPVDLVPARRPVRQRWYYAPVVPDPVLGHAPSRAKRQSKPPQRLTSSELGQVLSESQEPAERVSELLIFSTNGRWLRDPLRRRERPCYSRLQRSIFQPMAR